VRAHTYTGYPGDVRALTFSPGRQDGTIAVWDANHHEQTYAIGTPDRVRSLAFSRDGQHLASGHGTGAVRIWRARTGDPESDALYGPGARVDADVWGLAFNADGSMLAAGNVDGAVFIWTLPDPEAKALPVIVPNDDIYAVAFGPDGKFLAAAGENATIMIWDTETLQPRGAPLLGVHDFHPVDVSSENGAWIDSIAFGLDGKAALAAGTDRVSSWNLSAETYERRACRIARGEPPECQDASWK